jgi:hypothetical protein
LGKGHFHPRVKQIIFLVQDGEADVSVTQDVEAVKSDDASQAFSKEELILNLVNIESEKENDEKEEVTEGGEQDQEEPEKVEYNYLSILLLLQRSLLPGGIILQGVLLLQGSMSIFACHYG